MIGLKTVGQACRDKKEMIGEIMDLLAKKIKEALENKVDIEAVDDSLKRLREKG